VVDAVGTGAGEDQRGSSFRRILFAQL
jgi:hypothetical protein